MAPLSHMGPIGVCSWSLRAGSPDDLAEKARAVGVPFVQLHLDPLREGAWSEERTVGALGEAGVAIRSGMMGMRGEDYSSLESIRRTGGLRPDEHWAANLAAAEGNAGLAQRLGLDLVSFHAGFLPHEPDDPERAVLIDRLRAVVDAFAAEEVSVALETGQEAAETLVGVLEAIDRPTIGVNFDPANLLLYDMGDPVASLRLLAPWVRQIHVKDARRTLEPGTWGAEVVVGTGAVDWRGFFFVVEEQGIACDLMIEREAGDDRIADIRAARALVEGFAS